MDSGVMAPGCARGCTWTPGLAGAAAAEVWFYAFPVIAVLGVILLWFGARGKRLEEEARNDPDHPPHR